MTWTDTLAARDKHPDAHLPDLWLGRRGRLTDSGIAQMVADRGKQAGLGDHLRTFCATPSSTNGSLAVATRAT